MYQARYSPILKFTVNSSLSTVRKYTRPNTQTWLVKTGHICFPTPVEGKGRFEIINKIKLKKAKIKMIKLYVQAQMGPI